MCSMVHWSLPPRTHLWCTADRRLRVGRPPEYRCSTPILGEAVWSRDIAWPLYRHGDAEIAFDRSNRGIAAIDLETGEQLWDQTVIGTTRVVGHYLLRGSNHVLVTARSETEKNIVALIEARSGELVWRRTDILQQGLITNSKWPSDLHNVFELEGDLIFLFTPEGPMRINQQSGDVVWRTDIGLDWESFGPPTIVIENTRSYDPANPSQMLHEGKLLVAHGHAVTAVDVERGELLWTTKKKGGRLAGFIARAAKISDLAKVRSMLVTPHGLLVFKSVWGWRNNGIVVHSKSVNMLDLQTGEPLWKNSFANVQPHWNQLYLLDGDRLLVAEAGGRLNVRQVDLNTGKASKLARVKYKGDKPDQIQHVGRNILISGSENATLISPNGETLYTTYVKSPRAGLLERMLKRSAIALFEAGIQELNRQTTQRSMASAIRSGRNLNSIARQAVDNNNNIRQAGNNARSAIRSEFGVRDSTSEHLFFYADKHKELKTRSIVRVDQSTGTQSARVILSTKARGIDYAASPAGDYFFLVTARNELERHEIQRAGE